jgi:DNA-binding HxlR family transcriptional regulator
LDINSIPDTFQSKFRIAIVAALITGPKTFKQIKDITNATDGNLSVHLSKLEELGFINVDKEFIAKKPCSTYSLTEYGDRLFREYVDFLENLLNETK